MEMLIVHTSSAGASGGNGQHPYHGEHVYTGMPGGQGCVKVSDERDTATKEMRTAFTTTDTPVQKVSQLTWRELWEMIDVVRIMKEHLSTRIRIVVSSGGYPKWPPVPRDPSPLGPCWLQVSVSA